MTKAQKRFVIEQAVKRVREFIRQRTGMMGAPADDVYTIHTDVNAEPAELRLSDLRALVAACTKEENEA